VPLTHPVRLKGATMKQCITRIAVLKTASLFGILGYILGFPILAIMHVFANYGSRPDSTPTEIFYVIAIPLFVAFFFFIFSLLGAVIYNVIARLGIMIEFNTDEIKDG
jgi:hypothetical protein